MRSRLLAGVAALLRLFWCASSIASTTGTGPASSTLSPFKVRLKKPWRRFTHQAEKALVTASDATHVHSADIQPEARFIWSIRAFRSNFFKSWQQCGIAQSEPLLDEIIGLRTSGIF